MAIKNTRKIYIENGYYHIYNRGVEKRRIFQDEQDYAVFLSYLKTYLSPFDREGFRKKLAETIYPHKEGRDARNRLQLNNYFDQITLIAYCLMPNHFHFFVKQTHAGAIDQFMNSFGTRYVMYFNRRYERVGPLYQSRYKAVLINNEAQYLHISRYIHKQALVIPGIDGNSQPSSYPDYIGLRKTEWLHPEEILSFFSENIPAVSYARFVEEYEATKDEEDELELD